MVSSTFGVRPALWIKGIDVIDTGATIDYNDYIEYAEDLWLNEKGSTPGTSDEGEPYRAIAKIGGYKLVVRKKSLGDYAYHPTDYSDPSAGGVRYNPDGGQYILYRNLPSDKWNPKTLMDFWLDSTKTAVPTGGWNSALWGERLAVNSEVIKRAVGSDALTNIGVFHHRDVSSALPNTYSVGTYGTGFSVPKVDNPKIAFPLSAQEAARYSSYRTLNPDGSTWDFISRQTEANWQGLDNYSINGKDTTCWLRSYSTVNIHCSYLGNNGSVYTRPVNYAHGVRPALWIDL